MGIIERLEVELLEVERKVARVPITNPSYDSWVSLLIDLERDIDRLRQLN